uniref:Reverse transcriptase domain-containing protein n=1 Tax=Paramormyrops kingsleyae TaxID=1676925 RepID=A0A3B3Q2D7_9TELE
MCGLITVLMLLLHWNARSLIANGQEFKQSIANWKVKPDVMCIQESWLKPHLDFVMYGYVAIRQDRVRGGGGGCVTFVKQGVPHRVVGVGSEYEYVAVEVWGGGKKFVIINFYNPCRRLQVNHLEEVEEQGSSNVIWCGDFNAHNTLWGSEKVDINGQVIEELLEEKNLVCLNDGTKTRIEVRTGRESVLDLTLVSSNVAALCTWNVYKEGTMGSDHYPVLCSININLSQVNEGRGGRWVFERANWDKFQKESDKYLNQVVYEGDIEMLERNVRQGIMTAALESVPKSQGKIKRKEVLWWNDECRKAVQNRNKAFKVMKRSHNFLHMVQYKCAQAIVRKTVRQAKRICWRTYCSSIGDTTQIGDVWTMIKKMGGERRDWSYPVLSNGNEVAVTNEEKGEMLVNAFAKVHSTNNLSEEGKRGREKTSTENLDALQVMGREDGDQNLPFSLEELSKALAKTGLSAPGKDEICYIMLKHLSDEGKKVLLGLFNKVWEAGRVPKSWKEAIIIPVRKPGKDSSKPSNYQPIALTSHICKLMERMINERLMYVMEKQGMVTECQSGFRRGRGTMDAVLCLEDEVRKAQVNKETVVAVFFDVEKAYDMLWREGLMIKLYTMGIRGRLFNWVRDFLKDRTIQVRIGKILSFKQVAENGTPQGSVISPTLFSIMINDIYGHIQGDMGRSLFADDGALWKRGRNVEYIVKKLQEGIQQVERWGIKWSFKFSVEKSKVMFFTRKKVNEGINLKLYGSTLEKVTTFCFLGLHFDPWLTWGEHIRKVESKCKKVLNTMRCLTGREWGADYQSLKYIYVSLIRSRIDYGSVVYRSAAKSVLTRLDKIQARALRLCLGAVKTSPVCALQVEAGELPLHIRRKQLLVNYWVNLKGRRDSHPIKRMLRSCWEKERVRKNSFGWVGDEAARDLGVRETEFCPTVMWPDCPVWKIETMEVDFQLRQVKSISNNIDLVGEFYRYVEHKYGDHIQIYTDGSKDPESGRTGSAFVIGHQGSEESKRTSNGLSVYTVELYAIMMALEWVGKEEKISKILIGSDSLSALYSLSSGVSNSRQDLVYAILLTYMRIKGKGKQIQLIWVPAHIGILGNERVDKLAKQATKKDDIEVYVKMSKAEGKSIVWKEAVREWQQQWDRESKGRHLYGLQNKVGTTRNWGGPRREETVRTRLRIGHSNLNSSLHIIGKHPTGFCEVCKTPETIEHVLINCRSYDAQRRKMMGELRKGGLGGAGIKDVLKSGMIGQGKKSLWNFLATTGWLGRI